MDTAEDEDEKAYRGTSMVRNLSPIGYPSFWLIGLNFMKENIKKIDLKDKLIDGILDLINHDRLNSNFENRQIIAKLIHILLALQLYKGEFEKKFLDQSQQFFEKLSAQENFNERSLSHYLVTVENILKNESDRIRECLDICTHDSLTEVIQDLLVTKAS